jgi:FixJ family two-component response regulator
MKPTVCLIDDDPSVQRAVRRLLNAAGYPVLIFSSATDFLALSDLPSAVCLLVDLRMPGMTGTDLQAELAHSHGHVPLIMMSGHADAATRLRVMAAGAVSFLNKPFEEDALFGALELARDRSRAFSPA